MLIHTKDKESYVNLQRVTRIKVDSSINSIVAVVDEKHLITLAEYDTAEEAQRQLDRLCNNIDKVYDMS